MEQNIEELKRKLSRKSTQGKVSIKSIKSKKSH